MSVYVDLFYKLLDADVKKKEGYYPCLKCNRTYYHRVMLHKKNTFDYWCIRCFNINEERKKNEKTDTLQPNDNSKNSQAA